MSESPTTPSGVSAGDRLSLTLFVSLAVHALIILGVGFTWAVGEMSRTPPMLEVTLADTPQEDAPEDHDFLAQANQDGGGESEEAAIPQKPQGSVQPGAPEGNAPADAAPQKSSSEPAETTPVVTGSDQPAPAPEKPAPEPDPRPKLSAQALLDAASQVAAEQALAEASESVSARYPSKRRISARTRAHAAAAYMRQWVDKVEEIGNLNYPSEARRRNLSGRLILEVTLRPDGSVRDIKTLRPSPYPALDQAARRIVDLASPFARIPDSVLDGKDLLVITRTWEFDNAERFSAE